MRDYWLDPHTWVSTVPDAIAEKLGNRESAVRQCLTALGPAGWQSALTSSSIHLPAFRTRQAFLDFLEEGIDEEKMVLLAITFTRIRIACHLRGRTECLADPIRGRDAVWRLNDLALQAAETLLSWKWAIPFDADGVFDFDLWKLPDIPH